MIHFFSSRESFEENFFFFLVLERLFRKMVDGNLREKIWTMEAKIRTRFQFGTSRIPYPLCHRHLPISFVSFHIYIYIPFHLFTKVFTTKYLFLKNIYTKYLIYFARNYWKIAQSSYSHHIASKILFQTPSKKQM